MIIGALGPAGSYSQKAVDEWSKGRHVTSLEIVYFQDIQDVFESVHDKTVDAGIVPIENSIEGSIGITLDQLLESSVVIVGEVVVPIKHCLLSKGTLDDIRIILSHPQALAQCRQFLKSSFPNTEIRTTGSTSHAAKLAHEFVEMAAIASRESAEKYRLEILIKDIQDKKNNHTRFIVISSPDISKEIKKITSDIRIPDGQDYRTSIIVYIEKDSPGALYTILGEFASRDINLTRIESRPSKRALGDYVFYIDFNGSINKKDIKEAIDGVAMKVKNIKVLGSYPIHHYPEQTDN